MLCQHAGLRLVVLSRLQQFVRDVQSGHDGYAVEALRTARAADFAHLAIQVAGSGDQTRAFLGGTADQEFAIEDIDGNRCRFAHALFSRERRRAIIASTRERACSFLASRFARSAVSCSWLTRRLRFSSASR